MTPDSEEKEEESLKIDLLPVYFPEFNEREWEEYGQQVKNMKTLYEAEACILPAVSIEDLEGKSFDMAVFFKLTGSAFRYQDVLKRMDRPVLVLTSEFGTVEMWDWEIVAWMREKTGLCVFAPYSVEMAKVILRAAGSKKELRKTRFLMLQDDPGEGMQAYIFKRFYWWEKDCVQAIEGAFGVTVLYRSWKEVNERARGISDARAAALWKEREEAAEGVKMPAILNAVKLYMALKETVDEVGEIGGIGSNCLNESFHSDTTPCLAWNWMFQYDGILWACEADLVSVISQYIFWKSLRRGLMMTNIYPFLMGMAALRHEKISAFPDIADPQNHALGVHCGYFGFVPRCFCESWVLRPAVLEIVNGNSLAVDCRMHPGPITMAKLHSDMKTLTVIEAEIEDYVQYPGSDCRNGALIRYTNRNGHRVMEELSSHHAVLIQGNVTPWLSEVAKVYGFSVRVI